MLIYHKRFLPHFETEGAVYFVTFRLREGFLSRDEIVLILNYIKAGHQKLYNLIAIQVMSNHVHLLIQPNEGFTLSKIMQRIKGTSARNINLKRGTTGSLWYDESFDRIVRDQKELDEKLNYMYQNPVKAGIVERAEDYWGWFLQE